MVSDAPLCAAPDRAPRTPAFTVPAGATDCHVHVFGPADRYPYQDNRAYTPPDSTPDDLARLQSALGLSRAVVVQASVHGTDNGAVCDAIALDPVNRRGIAAVPKSVSEADLASLHAAGVRGIRVNLVDRGGMPYDSTETVVDLARRIEPLGWHVEFLVHVELSNDFLRLVERLAVPSVVGHLGYAKSHGGAQHPGYQRFLALMREGRCWAKMTGPYRISAEPTLPYDDVAPFAAALLEAAPDRLVWGSDWPHVMVTRPMPNDGDLFDLLALWVRDKETRRTILVENPARLYGFDAAVVREQDTP